MYTYFAGVKTIEELRQKYRELLKKYHPNNEGGSVEITQEINTEYDRLFAILSEEKSADEETLLSMTIKPRMTLLKRS